MKHILFCAALLVSVMGFSACTNCPITDTGRFNRNQYHDDGWIAQTGDTYSYRSKVGSVRNDVLDFDVRNFYGRETVWTLQLASAGTLGVDARFVLSDGALCKLCLVDKGTQAVTTLAEAGRTLPTSFALSAGSYSIKLVGYGAGGSIQVNLDAPAGLHPVSD